MQEEEKKTPAREAQEVVSWYVRDDGREVTDYYVQPCPLPEAAKPRTAPDAQAKKRRSTGVWIFIIIMVVLLAGVAAATLLIHPEEKTEDGTTEDDHSASSIVDIFDSTVPTINRVKGDAELRFSCVPYGDKTLTAQEVYAAVNPAVVMVAAQTAEDKASVGTGVILTEDGYVVTNAHVIAGSYEAWLVLDTGYVLDAELVGYDTNEDIALLKAVDVTGLPTAELGDSGECVVGDTVYAIGNPLGVELRGTLTSGLISAIDRRVTLEGREMTMLQTTAALNNGNSGGPLINEYGQIIGINTMKMSSKTSAATVEGLGFAIPAQRMVSVINDIMATGSFHGIPSLGIYVGQEEQSDGTYQLVIYEVTEGYGAQDAGLLPGDVILAADGKTLSQVSDLITLRNTHVVGESITLTVQRGSTTFDADVKLYAAE